MRGQTKDIRILKIRYSDYSSPDIEVYESIEKLEEDILRYGLKPSEKIYRLGEEIKVTHSVKLG